MMYEWHGKSANRPDAHYTIDTLDGTEAWLLCNTKLQDAAVNFRALMEIDDAQAYPNMAIDMERVCGVRITPAGDGDGHEITLAWGKNKKETFTSDTESVVDAILLLKQAHRAHQEACGLRSNLVQGFGDGA